MTVTKAELERLRSSLAKPSFELELTPEGGIINSVHSKQDERNRKQLRIGEQHMRDAQQKFRTELEKMRNQGQSRAQFNSINHTHECNPKM